MKIHNLLIYATCIALLAGCVSANRYSWIDTPKAPPKPAVIDLSDTEIKKLPEKDLCNYSFQNDDPRLAQAVRARGASCDPISLECLDEGFKRPSKAFSFCVTKRKADLDLALKKASNPAYGYCIDNGFKSGTQAMAICMSDWHAREQTERVMDIQQKQYDRARKDQAWRDLSNRLQQDAIRQRQNMPTSTTCQTYGSTTNCKTW